MLSPPATTNTLLLRPVPIKITANLENLSRFGLYDWIRQRSRRTDNVTKSIQDKRSLRQKTPSVVKCHSFQIGVFIEESEETL